MNRRSPVLTIENSAIGTLAEYQDDTLSYTADGKEVSHQSNGADVKSSIRWDGNALQPDSKVSMLGMEVAFKDKIALTDGPTLR